MVVIFAGQLIVLKTKPARVKSFSLKGGASDKLQAERTG